MAQRSRAFRSDHRYFLLVSGCFLALVFWTFARTYYLSAFFDAPALTPLVQVHGAVMSGWVLLLSLQSGLVAAGQMRWHRYLGWIGAVWATFVVILGSSMTLAAAAREVHQHTRFANIQLTVSGLELVQMLLFALLVTSAIVLRHRPDFHKRFMLLTIACLLPSALARLPIDILDNRLILWALDALVLTCVGIDAWRNRRLHPAFGWGAAVVLGGLHTAFYLTQTKAWISLGTRMVS
jgi:hypothetical protein